MGSPKYIFHKLSYLQYPLMGISMYYYVLFVMSIMAKEIEWAEVNSMLVFLDLSISLSTLQDTSKTQNKFSKRIWESPTKGKVTLVIMSLMTLTFIVLGLVGFLKSTDNVHKEISFGLIVLGIGFVGLLKAAIEMFENHRKDRNPSV